VNRLRESGLLGLALIGLVIWALASVFANNFLVAIPLALFGAVFVGQLIAQARSTALQREQDELLPVVQAAIPKMVTGLSVPAAFRAAAGETPSVSADKVLSYCFRIEQGLADIGGETPPGPVSSALFAMIGAAAQQGGEIIHPFRALAQMLASEQRLRRKQQLATIQIRWQANVLIIIAVCILVASSFSNQEALVFLFSDRDGRLLVIASLTLLTLGQIVMNAITARIADA